MMNDTNKCKTVIQLMAVYTDGSEKLRPEVFADLDEACIYAAMNMPEGEKWVPVPVRIRERRHEQ